MMNSDARRFGVRSALAMALASVSGFALIGAAQAQTYAEAAADDAATIAYDIPAQPLVSALLRFAEQTNTQILFAQNDIEGFSSNAVRGRYAPAQALQLLLGESGVRAEFAGDTLVIREVPQRHPQSGSADDPVIGAPAAHNEADADLVITGTRIRGAAPSGANVITLDRGDIDATGRTTLADVVQTLPQNFAGSQNDGNQIGAIDYGRNVAFGSTINLRGLGADATLTLLNGRRLAASGWGNFVDISTIPLAAVERIDVLADGASATYGSDAVAGVVNVILRRDFEGAETSLRYGEATRGDPTEIGFSHVMGNAWRTGAIVAGYEYRDRAALESADRAFSATSDLRLWGGSNFGSIASNPGNITRIGATPVVLAIPEGQDGTSLSESDLLPGVLNYRPFNEGNSLLPEQTSSSLFASARQEVASDFEVFIDVVATRREAAARRFQNNVTLTIPETNAYRVMNNLFPGQGAITMRYNMGEDLGPTRYDTRTDAYSIAVGGIYALANDWRIDASVSYSHNEDHAHQGNVFAGAALLAAALASNDPATAFNPFADGSNSPAAVLQNLTYDDYLDSESALVTYGLKADGPLFPIWGGRARAAFGIERREEEFQLLLTRDAPTGTTFNEIVAPASRSTDAIFAELYLPLVSANNEVSFMRALDVSMSLRYEEASDFGGATTPKLGVTWSVNDDLSLRGSWGESFKAPQFQQLFGGIGGSLQSITPALDPFATDGSTGALILSGTNPDLRPERADNWTAGFDFHPSWADGLRFEATYFDIDFVDRISDPGSIVAALSNPAGFEGVFFRNPTPEQIAYYSSLPTALTGSAPEGIEVIFDGRLTNLAGVRMRGVDLAARYLLETGFGDLQFFASASHVLQHTTQAGPASAPRDVVDTMLNPVDWRGRAGLAWSRDDWSASFAANYVDDYRDTFSSPNRRIASWTTWDAQLGHVWRDNPDGRGTQLTLNVQNLLDEDPPFANNPIGYAFDSQIASPVGRFIAVEVRHAW